MLLFLQVLATMLFIASALGYTFVVIKEKLYLKNNIILIDNRHVKQEHLDQTDMKEFFLDGQRIKAGDEIKVLTKEQKKYKGIILGAKKIDRSILIVTYKNEIKKFDIDNIVSFRLLAKYGKFFS